MAQSITHTATNDELQASVHAYADRGERRLRQVSAWLILYLALQAELGLAWDRQWHDLIGRDQFWIPPHILLYTGVGGAGLVALCVVMIETIRYRQRRPGVDDASTIPVLGFFHAPLGFVMLGFGALTDLVAAPFDNYWHQLYGIDVTLWSPFHIMGTIGGVLAGLGIVYAFASEAAYERQRRSRRFLGLNGPEWAALIMLAAFMELTLPSLTAFSPAMLGPFQLLTYPLPLALAGCGALIAAIRLTRRPGAATLTALLLWIEAVATQGFVPWALRTAVAHFGLAFRFVNRQPIFNVTLALLPLLFLLCAFLIDTIAFLYQRRRPDSANILPHAWLMSVFVAPFVVILPLVVVQVLLHLLPIQALPPDIIKVLDVQWSGVPLALPVSLLVAVIGALWGASLGDIWYWNKR